MCATGTKLPATNNRCSALSYSSCSRWAGRDTEGYATSCFNGFCIAFWSLIIGFKYWDMFAWRCFCNILRAFSTAENTPKFMTWLGLQGWLFCWKIIVSWFTGEAKLAWLEEKNIRSCITFVNWILFWACGICEYEKQNKLLFSLFFFSSSHTWCITNSTKSAGAY